MRVCSQIWLGTLLVAQRLAAVSGKDENCVWTRARVWCRTPTAIKRRYWPRTTSNWTWLDGYQEHATCLHKMALDHLPLISQHRSLVGKHCSSGE